MVSENLNSLSDAISNRIKSPLIGSIILTTALYNWEALTVLTFSETVLENRIIDFKAAVSWRSFVWPVALGTLFSLSVPWLNLAVNWWLQRPSYYNSQNADKWSVRRAQARTLLEEALADESIARRKKAEAQALEEEAIQKVNIANLEASLQEQAEEISDKIKALKKLEAQEKLRIKRDFDIKKRDFDSEIVLLENKVGDERIKLNDLVLGLDENSKYLLERSREKLNQAAKLERESRKELIKHFSHNDPIHEGTRTILRTALSNQELEIIDCAVVTGHLLITYDEDWATVAPLDIEKKAAQIEKGFRASKERVAEALRHLTSAEFLLGGEANHYELSVVGKALAIERLAVALVDITDPRS